MMPPCTHPGMKRLFCLIGKKRPHYELQRRYVRHGDCATQRAATHLPAGIDRVRTHASTSLLRMSAGILCLTSNGDWWWTMYSRALEALKKKSWIREVKAQAGLGCELLILTN